MHAVPAVDASHRDGGVRDEAGATTPTTTRVQDARHSGRKNQPDEKEEFKIKRVSAKPLHYRNQRTAFSTRDSPRPLPSVVRWRAGWLAGVAGGGGYGSETTLGAVAGGQRAAPLPSWSAGRAMQADGATSPFTYVSVWPDRQTDRQATSTSTTTANTIYRDAETEAIELPKRLGAPEIYNFLFLPASTCLPRITAQASLPLSPLPQRCLPCSPRCSGAPLVATAPPGPAALPTEQPWLLASGTSFPCLFVPLGFYHFCYQHSLPAFSSHHSSESFCDQKHSSSFFPSPCFFFSSCISLSSSCRRDSRPVGPAATATQAGGARLPLRPRDTTILRRRHRNRSVSSTPPCRPYCTPIVRFRLAMRRYAAATWLP